jgi:hypothetical protein
MTMTVAVMPHASLESDNQITPLAGNLQTVVYTRPRLPRHGDFVMAKKAASKKKKAGKKKASKKKTAKRR